MNQLKKKRKILISSCKQTYCLFGHNLKFMHKFRLRARHTLELNGSVCTARKYYQTTRKTQPAKIQSRFSFFAGWFTCLTLDKSSRNNSNAWISLLCCRSDGKKALAWLSGSSRKYKCIDTSKTLRKGINNSVAPASLHSVRVINSIIYSISCIFFPF